MTLGSKERKDEDVGKADGKSKTGREIMMEDIGRVVELKVAPLAQDLRKIKTALTTLSIRAMEQEPPSPPTGEPPVDEPAVIEEPPVDEPVEAPGPGPDPEPVQPRAPEEGADQDAPEAEAKVKPKDEAEDDPWSEFDLTE